MSVRKWILGLTAASLLIVSCEELTTQSERTTLTATIGVEGSPFVAAGVFLVGDRVRFTARVTDDEGREVATGGLTFNSDDENVVRILDASTGDAVFASVGQTTVSVVMEEPSLDPTSEKLGADMQIGVSEYEVELALVSTVTGADVETANALVNDTVRVVPTITLNGGAVASEIRSITSDNTATADPAAGATDQVALPASGDATLTVRFEEPDIPGDEPLSATLDLTVKDLDVQFEIASLVPGSAHLAAGDTLVTDSVRFGATVLRAGEMVQTSGAVWTSSDPSVVEIVGPGDVGIFNGTGTATISVDFADPKLPGAPFELVVPVSNFDVRLDLESLISDAPLADTLLTDTVRVLESVTLTLSGEARASSIKRIETSDSSRIAPIGLDSAVFVGTGSAPLIVTLAEPTLPRDTLQVTLPLEIATYLAEISPDPASLIMGDQVDYNVVVTYTRDGSQVSDPVVTFGSTDPNVILINDAATGAALARDTGSARVVVVSNDPTLPAGTVSDTTALTTITEERFYGAFSKTSGSFGASRGDTVIIENSVEHSFTATSRVEFDNGISAFVEKVQSDTLIFLVPAGGATGPLTLRNLIDHEGDPRDGVITRFDFEVSDPGPDDLFEPNDAFPLTDTDTVNLTGKLPFAALLAIDPTKTAAQDTNFFWLRNPNATDLIVDIRAETQQNADIDFFVCNGTGGVSTDPPTGYDPGACARPRSLNTVGQVEEQLGEVLPQGRHVFGFYCAGFQGGACPPSVPITYKVTIE